MGRWEMEGWYTVYDMYLGCDQPTQVFFKYLGRFISTLWLTMSRRAHTQSNMQ